ncbi:hypothetical protein [Nakamurella panacisegetis]|uniref:hypothetical protein n=1 Tax=Nakamurella panacisegetis TaxID=1090615 RepID=UPI0012FDAABE|nr:hypothetical protein [Nakamurella panacisegetis]
MTKLIHARAAALQTPPAEQTKPGRWHHDSTILGFAPRGLRPGHLSPSSDIQDT